MGWESGRWEVKGGWGGWGVGGGGFGGAIHVRCLPLLHVFHYGFASQMQLLKKTSGIFILSFGSFAFLVCIFGIFMMDYYDGSREYKS